MKRFVIYTKLEIKKSLKMLPKLAVGTLLLIFIVTVIAIAADNILSGKSLEENENESAFVDIGVVCLDDSWIMDVAKTMLKGNKNITSVVNLDFTDYDTAIENLEDNLYMAVIIIPDNAVKDIISGDNTPFQVIFPKNAGYEAAAIKEVADSAVSLLSSAQAGIYSVYDFYGEHNRKWYRASAIERLNERYIEAVLALEDFFNDTTVVATGELDVMEYYVLSGIILFLMLFGMNGITFMENYKKEIVTALSRNGVGTYRQMISRFAGILSGYIIVGIVGLAVLGIIIKPELSLFVKMLLGIIPVLMVSSSMVLLVQTVIKYKPAAIMAMFLIGVFQSFVTGGFIPQMMLPKALSNIGKFTPAFYMSRELSLIYLKSDGVLINTVILLALTAALISLSALAETFNKRSMGKAGIMV